MYEEVKKNNNDSVVIIKQGIFYISYGKDSEILNYLFHYEIKGLNKKLGFPNIDKVTEKLNSLKINYVVVNISKKKFKNNNYNNIIKVIKIVNKLNKLDSNLIERLEYLL